MNINDLPKSRPDGTPYLSAKEAMERYRLGTLDPVNKAEMERLIAITAEALPRILAPLASVQATMADALGTFAVNLQSHISELYARAIEPILPSIVRFNDWLERLDGPLRESLVILGENGWSLCMEIPFDALWQLRDDFENERADEAESFLCEYFDERLDSIEENLISSFPHRKKIISSAFAAHRRGEYELSVPVILAQADGICKELYDAYLFMSKDRLPQTAEFVKDSSPARVNNAILHPLAIKLPINQSHKERADDFRGLNRHLVLHGDSVDYDTRVNSLKAISLLNYVATVVKSDKSRAV